jgi:hypothetical protein
MYNGNFDITKMLDQSNLSIQRCRLIFWVECSVGPYLVLAKIIHTYNSRTLSVIMFPLSNFIDN